MPRNVSLKSIAVVLIAFAGLHAGTHTYSSASQYNEHRILDTIDAKSLKLKKTFYQLANNEQTFKKTFFSPIPIKSFISKYYLASKQNIKSNLKNDTEILNPNLLNIEGPNVTLIFKRTNAQEAFAHLAKLGNYGFVWVQNDPTSQSGGRYKPTFVIKNVDGSDDQLIDTTQNNQIVSSDVNKTSNKSDLPRYLTLNIIDTPYSKAFNSLLLASGLQAKIEDNIIYVGPNVRNTIFLSRVSRVLKLNQVSASSAADYLANLGASVTKTYTISTSVTEGAKQSDSVEGGSSSSTTTNQSQTKVTIYGGTIGPLVGLVATTDERLHTVTLVGDKTLVKIAEQYVTQLDKKQKQVALNVRVLDINLSDQDSFSSDFAFRSGTSFIVNEGGKLVSAFGRNLPGFSAPVANPGNAWPGEFVDKLTIGIQEGTTKVLASPTLILSEYAGEVGDGSIGRKYGNEGFVEVGDKVPINAAPGESNFCTYQYGLVGITLGARLLGVDQNDYVTFTMSPMVTGITDTVNIAGCGTVQLLNTRKVDTGSVRVKNGHTLILTGVLQENEIKSFTKIPFLGDLPVLGNLFRSTNNQSQSRELVILVSPKIIYDTNSSLQGYGYKPKSQDHKKLFDSAQ